jgi:hypothetical protein
VFFYEFPRYIVNILLVGFSAKVGREDIFEPTFGNDSSYEISNNSGVRVVNFAACKNSVLRSTVSPHRDIHKYTLMSPEGKMHNQIGHRSRHSVCLKSGLSEGLIVKLTTIW